MRFFRFAALALLSLVSVTAPVFAENARPNIILIMADDFGYECVTANGGESYKTPVLDKLAAGGVRFEQCHVQPLCTPTRVQLMTGKYNVRNYLNFGTLLESEKTFANVLKETGYATGICGNWQLGRGKELPRHFGFDESCLWQHTRRPPRYANPGLEYNGVEKDFTNGEYGPKLVNDFALDFITRHKEKPFFLYYPMMLTHDPFQPTPDSEDWDPATQGEQAKKNVKHFADMTAYMDKMIGQVVTKLEELGLRENTLVIFLGDNGTGKGVSSKFKGADYPGGKGSTHARGTHVPLIASWPAVMKEARVCKGLISSADFLPTICDAAGVKVPEGVDGVSFLPQLRGEKGAPREWLYTWYSPRQAKDLAVRECAFDQHYKLYKNGDFFALAGDLDEKKPMKVAELQGDAAVAAVKLQKVLDQYKDVRPEALDRAFAENGAPKPGKPNAKGKGKNKGQGQKADEQ
ncbi:arylsulfatase A [Roseimicrobium gellanilyticum]|uniref:Arylsulfatase A n=1 Tax=Roseimicrobium gellanilyticum TaxID=748857 RepID=A0A366HPN3_9BACT|nr:sulfatase-like hydrolase/transferase [Roseimicrobium gellanilyticum]RBP45625.1 arylsulfatase A [Roseimicrobium gellanilyticum]